VAEGAGVIGVVGAGTMGAGIAQLACQAAGARTLLHDPVPAALERGVAGIRGQLARGVERGRWTADEAQAAGERLEPVAELEGLARCELVIEAAPESRELKRELFERLSAIVGPECVLATNTSSLPITGVAAAAARPERVVGMHFFNPAPVMRLVEVIAGEQSGEAAVALARATGEAMGRRVILAADGPGFLVNRCGRPFGMEALRLAEERLASYEAIDRICRLGAGFRMGPFELMDLVGVDVGFDVQRSFWELSFGEPRWRPSPISARMVAAGRLGRKAGRGYYEYPDDGGAHRPDDPDPPPAGGGEGLVAIAGDLPVTGALRAAAAHAGYDVAEEVDPEGQPPWLIVECGPPADDFVAAGPRAGGGPSGAAVAPLQGGPRLILCAEGSLAALDPAGGAAGFHVLPPLDGARLVELTRAATTSDLVAERAERFFATLGKHVEWVGDAPGLALGRIVCQLVNEAAFALRAGVGSAEDVDAGMLLGLNHPHGPLHWADSIGLDHVLAVLDALADEYREERYRACPLLRQLVAEGRLGAATGAGFFEH
jgi:3-hydroxybutyryl-CoA dehydrogenase